MIPETLAPRDRWQAISRGLQCRCPACGQGRLFGKFLKPVAQCANCGEDFTAQRADDFPPYLVILILGHVLAPIAVAVEINYHPPMWAFALSASLIVIALALLMLQPVKGGVIALQWAGRMGDFAA
jgi:uncharacterized protein (DUF983 family)